MCDESYKERIEKALLLRKNRLFLYNKFGSLPWDLSNRLTWLTVKQLKQLLIDYDSFSDFMAFEIWLIAARLENKLSEPGEYYWTRDRVSFSEYEIKWFLTVMNDLKEFEKIDSSAISKDYS